MRRTASPVMIGRHGQIARITDAFDAAAAGTSTIMLIGGEAGVGKSRLAEHAMGLAAERQMTVLAGGCLELGGTSMPFAPIREVVRELMTSTARNPADGAPIEEAKDLASVFSDADPNAALADSIGLGEPIGQARLFEAWLALMRRLGRVAAPLVVVEDIHWADTSTLDLLRFMARNHHHTPFVMIATYRSDELNRRHPLLPVLAELQRSPAVSRLDVPALDRDEMAELVTQIRGEAANQEFVDAIQAHSEGNPFYAEELIAAEASNSPAHVSLREVLLARIATVDDSTQEVFRWLAVAGPELSIDLLGLAMGRLSRDLEPDLRDGVEQHVLVPVDDASRERYRFRHVLFQEAVYSELLPGERSRMHARLADVMSTAVSEEPDAAQLAYHWYAAHDLPRALVAAWRAARQAERMHAYADAYAQYGRVLELWDQVSNAQANVGVDRITVLDSAARIASVSAPDRAVALMREALEAASDEPDLVRLALLTQQYGRFAYLAGDGVAALEACRRAAEMLSDGPPTVARATALASLGQILMITMHSDEAKGICEEAVATAHAVGAVAIESHGLNSLGITNAYQGELDLGLEQLHQSLALAMTADSTQDVSRAYSNLIDVQGHSGRFDDAVAIGTEAVAYAEEHGLARWSGAIDLCEMALAQYRSGSWTAARTSLDRAERFRTPGVADIMIFGRTALLDVACARFDDASKRLASLDPLLGQAVEAQLIAPGAEAAAELALWRGHPEDARLAVHVAFDRLPVERPVYLSRIGPLFYLAVRAEADLAEKARARRHEADVAEARGRAVEYGKRLEALRDYARNALPNFAPQAEAWSALCSAERARLEGTPNDELWLQASRALEMVSMPYPEAYARWRLAEAILAGRGSRPEAAANLRRARAICDQLGAEPLLAEIESSAQRARLSTAEIEVEPVPKQSPASAAGLTEREMEVITLVAAGRTNREIAEALFITEGTAGAHVSNILGKLGAKRRTEAAAVAQRLGLLDA